MTQVSTVDSPPPSRREVATTPLPRRFESVERLEVELTRHLVRSRRQGDAMALLWIEVAVLASADAFEDVAQALTARLLHRVRKTDAVFQVGTAAFAVLLETDKHGAGLVQARLIEQLRGPYGMEAGPVRVHVDIGLAIPSEAHAQGSSMLQCAMDDVYARRLQAPAVAGLIGAGAANDQ